MSILDTHTSFIKYAQEQYQEAVNQQSPKHTQFWLEQLQLLCQQMYWLSQAAGPPVAKVAACPIGEEYNPAIHSYGSVVQKTTKLQPTEYHWNDGFEGVTLDVWGDKH